MLKLYNSATGEIQDLLTDKSLDDLIIDYPVRTLSEYLKHKFFSNKVTLKDLNFIFSKVKYDELPDVLVDAIVATEDARFFQHNGFVALIFYLASDCCVGENLFKFTFLGQLIDSVGYLYKCTHY